MGRNDAECDTLRDEEKKEGFEEPAESVTAELVVAVLLQMDGVL
jgi:hypothetical protein